MAEAKPAFDPNKPFEAAPALAESKPTFDPSKPFQPADETSEPSRPWYAMSGEGLKQGFKNLLPQELPAKANAPKEAPLAQENYRPWYSMSKEGLKQGAIDAIPTLGMMAGAGGVLATGGAALPAVLAAGAGGVGGESLKSTINSANPPKGGTYDIFPGGKHEEDANNASPTRDEYYNNLKNAGKSGLLSEAGGQAAGSLIGAGIKKIKGVASELSGVAQKEIENYASKPDEINKLAQEHQMDGKFDSLGAVNSMREDVLNDVRSEIANQHQKIGESLKGESAIPKFSIQPIKRVLEGEISKLDPVYNTEDIAAIKRIVAKIDQKAPETTGINISNAPFMGDKKIIFGGPFSKDQMVKEAENIYPKQEKPGVPSWGDIGQKIKDTLSQLAHGAREAEPAAVDKSIKVPVPGSSMKLAASKYHGYLNVQDAQATKNFLYKVAKGSYPNDEFFGVGPKVANAAKKAGRAAKEMLDKGGPKELVEANGKLEQLHDIEDALSPSLLNENKPASKMLSVGSGENQLDIKALSKLGELTGRDYIQRARDISTARTFANPKMFPQQTTGRSLLGPKVGGTIGTVAGGAVGGWPGAAIGGAGGAAAGGLASSPWAIKKAIDMAPVKGGIINTLGKQVPKGLLYQKLQEGKNAER